MNSKIMGKKWFLSGKGGKKKPKVTNSGSLTPYGLNFKNAITNYVGFRNRLKVLKKQLAGSKSVISQKITATEPGWMTIEIRQMCEKCNHVFHRTIKKPIGTKKPSYKFNCSNCGNRQKIHLNLKP